MEHQFKCQHCLKEFKKQGYYKKHVSLCEIINSREKDTIMTIDYNNEQLVGVIQHLIKKQTAMENELASLKRIVNRSKNKMTILDWINDNYTDHDDFKQWFDKLTINDSDLKHIFDNDLIEGIFQIFISNIHIENDNSPIMTFIQKPNVLYIYSDKKWNIIDNSVFEKYIDDINSKIIRQFKTWQDNHQHELNSNKYGDDYYSNIVNKIMGGTCQRSTLYSKIRSKIYHHIKINIKDIMDEN